MGGVKTIPDDPPPGGLFIRDELIDRLQIQNKPYVLELLGEPDEKIQLAAGRERWIYNRPLTCYSKKHPPDRQFTVVLRSDRVIKIFYKPPGKD